MSPVAPFPDLDAAREEASAWLARVSRGLCAAESAELREWSRRPVNRRALTEMTEIWRGLDMLSVLADVAPPKAPPRRAPRWAALAAGLVLLVIGASTFVLLREPPALLEAGTDAVLQATAYTSAVGEHRTIPLQDGSMLSLNSDTVIEVAFTPRLRSLVLHRGEAHFAVAHDVKRPFLVAVNGRTVRAVGTAFNIRRRGDAALDVLVTEGVVTAYEGDADQAAESVAAGQLLLIGADDVPRLRQVTPTEIETLTAWQRGVLVLDGITLEAAMAEVSRYTTRRIRIDEAQLRGLRLGGSFPTGDLAAILRALSANFGIVAVEDDGGTLHLKRATDGSQRG